MTILRPFKICVYFALTVLPIFNVFGMTEAYGELPVINLSKDLKGYAPSDSLTQVFNGERSVAITGPSAEIKEWIPVEKVPQIKEANSIEEARLNLTHVGYALVEARLFNLSSMEGFELFTNNFNVMPEDVFVPQLIRKRRNLAAVYDCATQEIVLDTSGVIADKKESFAGKEYVLAARKYPPIPEENHPFVEQLIRQVMQLVIGDGNSNGKLKMSINQLLLEFDKTKPELESARIVNHIHQDGGDFVIAIMFNRQGINNAEVILYDRINEDLVPVEKIDRMTQGQVYVLDDKRMFHYVTDMDKASQLGENAFRDMLILGIYRI